MEVCRNNTEEDKYDNDTEANMVNIDNKTEKCRDMTSAAMMNKYGNNYHDDNNFNETDEWE